MIGAGVGSVVAGGSFFGSSVATTLGFGSGFMFGFAGGMVGGAGTAWINGANFGYGLSAGLKSGIIGGISGGLINGIASGIRANKIGLNFWNGNGTAEMPFDNSFAGIGDKVEYSNESARSFSDSHSELKRLSSNVDDLYADGSVPSHKPYSSSNGYLRNPDGRLINGVTVKAGNTITVYLSKSAFQSSAQLYMTMHHEYMHAYFFSSSGLNFSSATQHRIIDNWHYDQALQWRSLGPFPYDVFNNPYFNFSKAFLPVMNNHYSNFGFKLINNMP